MTRRAASVDDAQREAIGLLRQALHRFTGAERRHRRRYQRHDGLLPLGNLRALFLLMTEEEATAGALAREAALTPGGATSMIADLEAAGLVERRRDPQDRRVTWVSLTDQGRDEVATKEAQWRRSLTEAFVDVPDEDLVAASRVLERLAALFDDLTEP